MPTRSLAGRRARTGAEPWSGHVARHCGPGAAVSARRDLDLAVEACDRLAERTSAAGTPWALGTQALANALAAPDTTAEEHNREAIDQLGRSRQDL